MITEAELHDYNKWLMEVWNPNQLYIPFELDAPKAYLRHKAEQLNIPVVSVNEVAVCANISLKNCREGDYNCKLCVNNSNAHTER
jgi:hypothetical protein